MDNEYLDWLTHMSEEEFARYIAENMPLDPDIATLLIGDAASGVQAGPGMPSDAVHSNNPQSSGNDSTPVASTSGREMPVTQPQRNETPCGPCKARKKKCTPISVQPRLCEFCSQRGDKECPSQYVKPPGATSSSKPGKDKDGFVYEYMQVD